MNEVSAATIRIRIWVLRAAYAACRPLPVRDRVVFASASAGALRGNLAALHAELERRGVGDRAVLLLHEPRRGLGGKFAMLVFAMRAEYYLATSRVLVLDDYFFPLYVITPKPELTVIQTWHAAGAFKKIGYSVVDKEFGASPELVKLVRIHSNYDYCLMGSAESVPFYAEAFGIPAERFVTIGIPRDDVFADAERSARVREQVRARYRLPDDRLVVLYAPTFRGRRRSEASAPTDLDLRLLKKRCADRYVVLLRLHPFVAESLPSDPELDGFVFDASAHPDFNELLIASDLLVTDYSSAVFEYSLLGRPMVFFAPDYEAYQQERGFYHDYRTWVPGPVFTRTEEVADHLIAGAFDAEKVAEFRRRAFTVSDGHASERVVDQLILPNLEAGPRPAAQAS